MDEQTSQINIKLHQNFPILIPYNLDLVNHGQNILYRTTKDPIILKLIDHDISLTLEKSKNYSRFDATEAIIVTFDNIQRYRNTNRFKYQVVIATDYTYTFAILMSDWMRTETNLGSVILPVIIRNNLQHHQIKQF